MECLYFVYFGEPELEWRPLDYVTLGGGREAVHRTVITLHLDVDHISI